MSYRQVARRRLRSQRKRKGENIVWAIQIGLCYCGVGGAGRWGVAVWGGGLCRNILRGRRPSHASGRGVQGGGLGRMGALSSLVAGFGWGERRGDQGLREHTAE